MNRTQKTALKNYDPVMALHRAMRSHQWRVWKVQKGVVYNGERRKSWWKAEFYCECGTRKFFVRDSVGRRVWSRYVYPAQYKLNDLGLDREEINDILWLIVMERELAAEFQREVQEASNERKAQ